MTAKPREPITHWGLSQVLNILYLIPSVMTHDCSTTGCPKKLTYRMLLETLCTQTVQSQVAGTTARGSPVTGKTFFGRFLLRLLAGSSAPKSHSWANLAPQHSILVRIWGSKFASCAQQGNMFPHTIITNIRYWVINTQIKKSNPVKSISCTFAQCYIILVEFKWSRLVRGSDQVPGNAMFHHHPSVIIKQLKLRAGGRPI